MEDHAASLVDILRLLSQLDGYMVVKHDGEEYVISRISSLNEDMPKERQLELDDAPVVMDQAETADEMLEKINRDIAMFQLQQEDDLSTDELDISQDEEPIVEDEEELIDENIRPPRRVRFEPLRGDLPPDLQG